MGRSQFFVFQSQTRSRSTCDAAALLIPDRMPICFNLRREAAPHATPTLCQLPLAISPFQSQTRSRSTCDGNLDAIEESYRKVSISDEKPLHMRPLETASGGIFLPTSISNKKQLHMRPPRSSC